MNTEKKIKARILAQKTLSALITLIIAAAVTKISYGKVLTSCGMLDKVFYSGALLTCVLFAMLIISGVNLGLAGLSFLIIPHRRSVHTFKDKYIKLSYKIFLRTLLIYGTTFALMLAFGIIWVPGKLIHLFG